MENTIELLHSRNHWPLCTWLVLPGELWCDEPKWSIKLTAHWPKRRPRGIFQMESYRRCFIIIILFEQDVPFGPWNSSTGESWNLRAAAESTESRSGIAVSGWVRVNSLILGGYGWKEGAKGRVNTLSRTSPYILQRQPLNSFEGGLIRKTLDRRNLWLQIGRVHDKSFGWLFAINEDVSVGIYSILDWS